MTRKFGLGDIYFMDYEGIELKVRKIKLRDISSYVISQMENEIKHFIKNFQLDCIEKYLMVVGDSRSYYIVMQRSPDYVTLSEVMQLQRSMKIHERLSLMVLVCRAMCRVSLAGSVCHHGHLHPGNILVKL